MFSRLEEAGAKWRHKCLRAISEFALKSHAPELLCDYQLISDVSSSSMNQIPIPDFQRPLISLLFVSFETLLTQLWWRRWLRDVSTSRNLQNASYGPRLRPIRKLLKLKWDLPSILKICMNCTILPIKYLSNDYVSEQTNKSCLSESNFSLIYGS